MLLNCNRRLPLHIQIAILFSFLMLLIGALLISFNYWRTTQLSIEHARIYYNNISDNAATKLNQQTNTMDMAINLLATMPITNDHTLTQRLYSLPQLQQLLHTIPYVNAVHIAYTNGDLFLLRRLTPLNRAKWHAPANADWLVQSILYTAQQPGHIQREFLYFDDRLKLLRKDEKPHYHYYDPRERSWYHASMNTDKSVISPLYIFASSQELGTTLSQRAQNKQAVISLDISLRAFSELLQDQTLPPSSAMVLINPHNNLIASLNPRDVTQVNKKGYISPVSIEMLSNQPLATLLRLTADQPCDKELHITFTDNKQLWFGSLLPINNAHGLFRLAIATPVDAMLSRAINTRNQSTLITLLLLLASLPVIWWGAYRIAKPLNQLRQNADKIRHFNFEQQKTVSSTVLEIDELAQTMNEMCYTIQQFLRIGNSLAAEHDLNTLLTGIMHETTQLSGMAGGIIYLPDRHCVTLTPALWLWQGENQDVSTLPSITLDHHTSPLLQEALQKSLLHQQLISTGSTPELVALSQALGPLEALIITMRNSHEQLIGLLVLIHPFSAKRFIDPSKFQLVEALAGNLSVTVEIQRLLKEQKNLLHSIIQLMAGAIDAKSAHTGGHCQRVPALTDMLATAAIEAKTGPFATFHLSPTEREELHIASWLHDCGKVTTPEFVIDKATKLETIHNRLHEIRMRIEVLKRDAKIRALEQQLQGVNQQTIDAQYQATIEQLDSDFYFIAECNIGAEEMSPAHVQRLQQIADQHWLRTLDDRVGISHDELQRKNQMPAPELPTWEPLLADRMEHLIPREPRDLLPSGHDFNMATPHYLYNHGELYNLSIQRGTLTDEERYKINEHITQTIVMLKTLPFPRNMSQVPEIAGGHHERMDGKGYPCGHRAEHMSITARIVAIADVFEALTAVDRPYKTGKTLSESLSIMAKMVENQHLDPQLFTLFLSSGIWLEYAQRYMRPEQIDEVDITHFMPTPPKTS